MDVRAVLLFGAGASYGVGGLNKKKPPPLGCDLFRCLAQEYPQTWGALAPEFRSGFKGNVKVGIQGNFEVGMQYLYENQDPLPNHLGIARLLQDMAIFFSSFEIVRPRQNLYYRLFDRYRAEIHGGLLRLATINYDCLIEYALAGVYGGKLTPVYWGDGLGIRVLKIHGSCNFFASGVRGHPKRFVMGTSTLNAPPYCVEPRSVQEHLSHMPIPPAMCLYMPGKKAPIIPTCIAEILHEFQEIVRQAQIVIAVGVNPNVEDSHIWTHLKEARRLCLVANETACETWRKDRQFGKADAEVWPKLFRGEFERICHALDETLTC